MYQLHADIFRKISLYASIARLFKDEIMQLNVSNEIEEYFGRTYCRIYVHIELKDTSTKRYELQERMYNHFSYEEKEYFSFYLTTDGRDTDEALRNIEENMHYDYIWNLLSWMLQNEDIKINAVPFKNQYQLKQLQKEQHKKYEAERTLIENAVNHLAPEKGDYIAIKQWRNNPLRLGVVEKVTLPAKRQTFSMDLLELKKDLSPGKVKINLWNKTEIYAVIQPKNMSDKPSKSELITMLEEGTSFNGLLWRRPEELWKVE
jgi:hypothetical protein